MEQKFSGNSKNLFLLPVEAAELYAIDAEGITEIPGILSDRKT